jgi:hypothetical protein
MSDRVLVDGEALSAARRPPPLSRIVQASSERLLEQLDLPLLVTSFDAVGANLHAAFLGVAPFHDLQMKVQRTGYALTRLGERASVALESSRHVADKLLDDLETVYSLLVDDLEDVALSTLRSANHGSASLAQSTRALADDFEACASDLQHTLELTLEKRADQEARRAALARECDEYRVLLRQAVNSKAVTDENYEEADRLYRLAVQRESVAGMKSTALQLAQVATFFGSILSSRSSLHMVGLGGVTALSQVVDAEVLRVREEKAVHLHERHKQRTSKLDISREVAELTARLRLAREEDEVAETTVRSLEDAVNGLRCLSTVMLKAEVFWGKIETHCERSDSSALQTVIESSKSLPPHRRTELWTSDSFKKRAVIVYAPWVALHNVCGDYVDKMRGTRAQLYRLLEHPDRNDGSGTDGEFLALASPSRDGTILAGSPLHASSSLRRRPSSHDAISSSPALP